ncbi:hypothetical protein EUTSA_v10028251mg [Eutrema salsugineum]|uniref:Glabrous enhancer-binding protein-like C-terminal domain-containing protein n=1 Tax=Eutrema salsugineum TaxID=72664 RepID=V4M534_EUTSA|nr:hypothetical protein EUTSA_v10028251mg [Eutrema salsugineum]
MAKSATSSDGEEDVLVISSGEEEDNQHTIIPTEENEPEDHSKRSVKKTEACGSGKAKVDVEEESSLDVTESDEWFENSFLVPSVEILGVDSLKELWSKVPIESKKKTEEKIKLLKECEHECKNVEEILKSRRDECVLQRLALLSKVTSVITEAK